MTKNFYALLTLSTLCSLSLFAQVNIERFSGGIRLKPNTRLLANTHVTPTDITSNNWSEPDYCTTPDMDTTAFKQLPWYGNEEYLDNILDSVGYPPPDPVVRVEQVGVRYRIPLVFWVYNNGAGTDQNMPGDDDIQITVDSVNAIHRRSGTGFRYYIPCNGIRRVNSDRYVNIRDYETVDPIFMRGSGSNFVKGAINIHVARNNVGMYNPVSDAIFVQRRDVIEARARATVAHEIGHAMGLLFHTHQFQVFRDNPFFGNAIERQFVEPVDHSRRRFSIVRLRQVRICSITGDGLCDTPADPRLDGDPGGNYDDINPPCDPYFGTESDPWGDRYDNPPAGSLPPDPANVMSYGRRCRTIFTRDQIAVMVHRVERGLYRHFKNGYKSQDVVFDTFEPNNSAEQGRNIPLNSPEELTFHKSYRRTGSGVAYNLGSNQYDGCDVDWIWFRSSGGNIRIETSGVSGQTNADTELRLYNASSNSSTNPGTVGSLITSNNNGGSGNFSRIIRNLPAGTNYFVEVINRSPNVTGYYTLEVSTCPVPPNPSINGPNEVCNSNTTYQVIGSSGLPVRWQVTGNLAIVSGATSTTVTIRSTGSGGGQIDVEVGTGICTVSALPKNVQSGGAPGRPNINGPNSISFNNSFPPSIPFTIGNPVNGITYEWRVSGGTITATSSNTREIAVTPTCGPSQMTVEARAFDGCNRSGYRDKLVSLNCGSGNSNFAIYPNPTNQYFDVAHTENNQLGLNNSTYSATSTEKLQDEVKLELYNPQNAKLKTIRNKKKVNRFMVDHLKPGIYVLHIHYQGEVYQEKVAIKTE